jgi:bifunctional UDP-N-acetylglucosamine pyrophosphorylase/glucosamine-1-phosphate N-acetyltransferase
MKGDINKKLWAVILAAGKGKRISARPDKNKVIYEVAGKPMLLRTIELLKRYRIGHIIVVVGFAKDSVIKLLPDDVDYVVQRKRLGTAHALKTALPAIPKDVSDILVLNGDDSFWYTPSILRRLYRLHKKNKSAITFLTLILNNPSGLGRIIRNKKGEVVRIVEEKDATEEEKKIKEINPACYIFSVDFVRRFINRIKKSPVSSEYYIVDLVDLAVKNGYKISTLQINGFEWRGVNTLEELREAERMLLVNK